MPGATIASAFCRLRLVTPFDHRWAALNFIADFGDLAAILPAVAAASVVLWARGRRRAALIWTASFLVATTIVFLAKAAVGQSGLDLSLGVAGPTPSGHTTTSIAYYGALAVLLQRALGGRRGWAAGAAALALAIAVITAIEMLGWHPWADVVLGVALGGASAAWAGRALARVTAADGLRAVGAALLVVFLLHGKRLVAEDGVVSISHEVWPDAARAQAEFERDEARRAATHPQSTEDAEMRSAGR